MPWVFQVHIGGIVPAPQIPSLSDEAGFAVHVTRRGSNIDLAPIHLPRVSVNVSGVAPDAHYRDGEAACAGLAGAHDQEEDVVVLL